MVCGTSRRCIFILSASIQEKKGNLYAVLSIPTMSGKSKTKWVSMHLKANVPKRVQKQRLDEIRIEYSQLADLEYSNMKFCEYIKKWNEETKDDKSITTYDGYVHMIDKYVYPYFNEKGYSLMDLRPMHIEAYYRHLQRDCGLSGNTALKHHQIINTSLKYAVYNRFLRENPCDHVKRPKKEKTEHDFYNLDELRTLMRAAKGDTLETVIYLTIWFGLRRSEVLGIKWSNIDFENHRIFICETVVRAKVDGKLTSVPKDKMKSETSNRVLSMSQPIENYLKQLQQRQSEQQTLCGDCYVNNEYVCVNTLSEHIKPDYVTGHFSKLLEKNKLRHIKFHDLRHSCASYMLSQGFSLKQIQELLGHSNYNFTADTYTHVDFQSKVDMSNAISEDLGLQF